MLKTRAFNLFGFIICAGLLSIAAYLQIGLGLEPCPLCVIQRLLIALLGIISLIAVIHNPKTIGNRIYSGMNLLLSIAGVAASSRQVWLQHFASADSSTCLPGFTYMIKTLPLSQTLKYMLMGTADCADITFKLLGLSISEWTLIAFVGFAIIQVLIWRNSLPAT